MLCAVANDSKLLAVARMAKDGNNMFADVVMLLFRAQGLNFEKRQVHTRRCQLARNPTQDALAAISQPTRFVDSTLFERRSASSFAPNLASCQCRKQNNR